VKSEETKKWLNNGPRIPHIKSIDWSRYGVRFFNNYAFEAETPLLMVLIEHLSNAQRVQPYHRHWNGTKNGRYSPIVIPIEHHPLPASRARRKGRKSILLSSASELVVCRLSFIINSRLWRTDLFVDRKKRAKSKFGKKAYVNRFFRTIYVSAREINSSPSRNENNSGTRYGRIFLRKGVVTIRILSFTSDGSQWVEMGGI